jgi:hypothetical protein
MAKPNLPPYLGTWDELVQALLNNPFLGSGGGPRTHFLEALSRRTESASAAPSAAASLFVMAAALKDVAARLPEGQEGTIGSAIVDAADDWEDWYCGNGPRPLPHVVETAAELFALASTLEVGTLRDSVVSEAGTLLQKSFGAGRGEEVEITSIAS